MPDIKPHPMILQAPDFYVGFKGKGMCSHCSYSELHKPYVKSKPILICCYYNSSCKQVSRNCSGIRNLRKDPLTEKDAIDRTRQAMKKDE